MSSERGEIELLLLLCCLVGVVSFLAISLAFTRALLEPPEAELEERELTSMLRQKQRKEVIVSGLEEKKRELERQKEEKEKTLSSGLVFSEAERQRVAEELAGLKREYDILNRRIECLRKELALVASQHCGNRTEKERELKALQDRLEDLKRRINEKNEILAQMSNAADRFKQKKEEFERDLEEVRAELRKLKKERDQLKTRVLWAASSEFKRPLFVECRATVYIFYPRREAVSVNELDNRDVFRERAVGHDIIVLFVRPDGFESFRKAYAKVKALSIGFSYEPLETGQSLDFLAE